MAVFTPPARPAVRPGRGGAVGWTLLVVALVAGLVLTFLPSPYLIEQPGPVFDTLGTAEYEGQDEPLITVDGHETYPTYHQPAVQLVLRNAVRWARNPAPAWKDVANAPNVPVDKAPETIAQKGGSLHKAGEEGYR